MTKTQYKTSGNRAAGLCRCGKQPLDGVSRCQKCIQRDRDHFNRWRTQNKWMVLWHYSAGEIKCACCGEDNIRFLTVDHTDGGGREHRDGIAKDLGYSGGRMLYDWIIKNNFPDGFQVLCGSCNMAKKDGGECPHKLPKISKDMIVDLINQRVKAITLPTDLRGLITIKSYKLK